MLLSDRHLKLFYTTVGSVVIVDSQNGLYQFNLDQGVREMQYLTNNKSLVFLTFLILLTLIIVPFNWNIIKIHAYMMIRNLSKIHLDYVTRDFNELSNSNFIIKYKENKESALLVAKTGSEILQPVNRILGYNYKGTVPVILYPTMEELNKSFGWEGDKSPMGVYWMGTIRILAPEAWVEEDENQAVVFKKLGPMAHEYTHLVVDYKTNGNYTRWFTEGVAQYVEKKITGFTLVEPADEAKSNLYTFANLDKSFDEQVNQELAYWQSLKAVEYIVDKHGEQVINDLLDQLSRGQPFPEVFKIVVGEDLDKFENNIKQYAKNK
ncbi:MAG: hypothetical protein PWQ67_1053 [Clostridia bacterium]|nr:hypothetical protein [Clostridia bacterium]MDN5322599.1 hypothetical protein [Clostridia bacterium]